MDSVKEIVSDWKVDNYISTPIDRSVVIFIITSLTLLNFAIVTI